jgi:hypothetical protein
MSLTKTRRTLADLRTRLDAQRAKAGLPPRKPGDAERWPVRQVLGEYEQRLAEAAQRSDRMQQNATPPDLLSAKQEQVLTLLLRGKPITESAKVAEVHRATIYRWLKEDFGFQAAFNRGQRELRRATQARLVALAEKATDAVERSVNEGNAKIALALLKGLGLLPSVPVTIDSDDLAELADAAAEQQCFRNGRANRRQSGTEPRPDPATESR